MGRVGGAVGSGTARLARYALVFLASFVLLQWAYQGLQDTAPQRFFIEQMTVRPGAALIGLLAPEDGVVARGHRLVWNGGRLSVLNGCDGAEVMTLLLAALAAARLGWRRRLAGAGLGLALVYGFNQLRLAGLYLAYRHDPAWFELIHGVLGPLVLIALTLGFFVWWTGGEDDAPRLA